MKLYMSHSDAVLDFPCSGLMYSMWKLNRGSRPTFKCVVNESRPPRFLKLLPAPQHLVHQIGPSQAHIQQPPQNMTCPHLPLPPTLSLPLPSHHYSPDAVCPFWSSAVLCALQAQVLVSLLPMVVTFTLPWMAISIIAIADLPAPALPSMTQHISSPNIKWM